MKNLLLLVLCTQLCACPISLQANIRNDSENTIRFIWKDLASDSTKVEPRSAQLVPMTWGTRCLTVVEENQFLHFQLPENLPRGVQTTGRFDSVVGFSLVYDGSRLSFERDDGRFIPMDSVESCKEA